nr:hypothetical protein [uncultured Roseovarius sp.]
MSKFNWRNGFAVGLTVGITSVVALIVWGKPLYDFAKCVGNGKCDGYAAKYEAEDVPESWWWYWSGDLVSSSDSLAQWIMALLTIAAVFLLWRTLVQTNKTNAAAIKAAEAALDANEIMRTEQRPWVTLDKEFECNFFDRGGYQGEISWNYGFVNKGKSPAYAVERHGKFVKGVGLIETLFKADLQEFADYCVNHRRGGGVPIIFPGEATDFSKYSGYEMVSYERLKPVVEGDTIIYLCCHTYRLGLAADCAIGVEARLFFIEENEKFLGPWGHVMREYSQMRIVK